MYPERRYYVYIMASRSLTFYTGITNDIHRRAYEHKHGLVEGFTKKYRIQRLVYYECFRYVKNAIAREKQDKVVDPSKADGTNRIGEFYLERSLRGFWNAIQTRSYRSLASLGMAIDNLLVRQLQIPRCA